MFRSTVVIFLLVSLSRGYGIQATTEDTPVNPDEIPVAIEWDESVIPDELTPENGIDLADGQNTEDDPDQFKPVCGYDGEYHRDPKDCGKFYQCNNGIAYHMDCSAGLYFSMEHKVCDWPSNVPCDLDRCDRRRVGRLSDSSNNAISTATCPKGYLPLGCAASNPRRSDGTSVDGRDCVAVNGVYGSGQRAIATCASVDNDDYKVVSSGNELRPSAKCPSGFRILNCFVRNDWNHFRFAFPAMDISRNTCSSDVSCWPWRCSAQAVCRRRP